LEYWLERSPLLLSFKNQKGRDLLSLIMGWDYCCCAIPILNVGAYSVLAEQFVVGILVGTLSFATPSLVGASVPFSQASYIIMALGYIYAAVQLLGFLGIFKEKAALFSRYVMVNWIILYLSLSVAAAFIGISAGRHQQAVDACEASFFAGDTGTTTEDSKGEQICNIFCWSTLGVMGALWVLLALVQTYFVLVLRNYGVTQRADHTKYHSIYSAHDGDNNIMLNNVRSGNGDEEAWNARPSTDSWRPHGEYRDDEPSHSRAPSNVPEKGYGVGMGTGTTLKQASVDDAYLEHPSKALKDSTPTKSGSSYYDPPTGSPPSYHGHDSEGHDGPKSSWQKQQPYNPYQPSGSRI